MIVEHIAKGGAPAQFRSFQDRVTGVWCAGLHFVGNRHHVIVTGTANAARVDDQPTISQADDPRYVGMPAQDEGSVDTGRTMLDLLDWRRADTSIVRHRF